MCGIVGVYRCESYGLGYKEKEFIEQALVADAVRGIHGTGMYIAKKDSQIRTLKMGSNPHSFFNTKQFQDFFRETYKAGVPDDCLMVGHNRYRTYGTITTENAHPFRAGNITLVHNGTIQPYSKLPRFHNFDVDSHALTNAIAELGVDEAISLTHGAYAVAFFDQKEGTLNLLRNSQRPLSFAVDIPNKRLFFASEGKMLEWILYRNDIKDLKIESLPENMLHTFKLGEIEPLIREIKGPILANYNRGPANYYEVAEAEIIDLHNIVELTPPPKRLKKKATLDKAIKEMKRLGVDMKIVKEHNGLKKGDFLGFKIHDYADENPLEESFIVMGESPTLPKTSIRFRIKGAKLLESFFSQKRTRAKIANIVEYPNGVDENGDLFVVWVVDPEDHSVIPSTAPKSGGVVQDMYGRSLENLQVFVAKTKNALH